MARKRGKRKKPKKQQSMYFVGRNMQRRLDGKRKVTFYSRHDWPWFCASILVDSVKEIPVHFEAFKEACERYQKNPSEYTGLRLNRGAQCPSPALRR
jgi:hypothetical protein